MKRTFLIKGRNGDVTESVKIVVKGHCNTRKENILRSMYSGSSLLSHINDDIGGSVEETTPKRKIVKGHHHTKKGKMSIHEYLKQPEIQDGLTAEPFPR